MANQTNLPTKKRLNVTIANGNVVKMEQLRSLMERKLSKRLSIAEVVVMMMEKALADLAKDAASH